MGPVIRKRTEERPRYVKLRHVKKNKSMSALPEDMCSILITICQLKAIWNSCFRGVNAFFGLCEHQIHMVHRYVSLQNIHTHEIKINKISKIKSIV